MLYCLNPSCPQPVNPPENLHCQHCGERLALRNRFRALRPLGKGGFGTTYLAQDQDNRNKLCVVKRFTYISADPANTQKAEQLFEQEAERLDQLVHPQIPRLLAYFQEDNYLYLVQEFIVGQTLQTELNEEGKFSEAKIEDLLRGLLPILKFIHSRKIIHRDLKPDNIMRRHSGELVLIDFGVAKLLEQSSVLPQTATTIGTPGYAAPEQIQGRVTPASDLFALGATCFQLMTKAFTSGQISPVEYDWVQRWHHHADGDISPKLSHILSRLITLDDRQRYPTASAVLKDLAQTDIKTTVPAPPSQPSSQVATVAVSPAPPAPQTQTSTSPAPESLKATVQSLPKAFLQPPPVEAPQKSVRATSVGNGFWLRYGLFTDIGGIISFAIAMVAAVVCAFLIYGSENAEPAQTLELFRYIYSFIGGILVSVGQWLALKKQTASAFRWLPATAVAFAVGITTLMTIGNRWYIGPLLGALAGILQWIALLTHRTPRAKWWILWMSAIYAIALRAFAGTSSNVAYGIILLLIVPFLDGLFLTWILRAQYHRPSTKA